MFYNYNYRLTKEDSNEPLFNVDKGFTYGTMFEGIYQGYKNYEPTMIVPENDKMALLLDVQKYKAAMDDINLFLDVYPNDEKMTTIYAECTKRYNQAVENYEKAYGPLCLDSEYLQGVPWGWVVTSFPWERGN